MKGREVAALFYLVIILLSFAFIKIIIHYAPKLGLVDVPNKRSFHTKSVPRGAGIGFVAAIFIGIGLYNWELIVDYWYIFAAILIVFIVGIIDDCKGVSFRVKFTAIFAATALMWWYGVGIDTLGVWFGHKMTLGWLALPFSMFALAGFTNALNLIDGLDGLAGSISIVILGFFGYIAYMHHDVFMWTLANFTIAGVIGFMLLNWNPAKIFMGDSGSLTLGFIISVVAVLSIKYIHPVLVLYIAAVPILDTLIVMTRRIRRGKSPFSPDKTHVHHILVHFFQNNVKKTVWFLTLLQICFSAIGIVLNSIIKLHPDGFLPLFALGGFTIFFILFYMILNGMYRRQLLLESSSLGGG